MKWPLIIDRSSHQQAHKGEKSLAAPGSEQVQFQMREDSQPHSQFHSRPFKAIFVSLFLAIVLPIASMFGDVFDLKLCGFDGFSDDLNVFNNEYEWEKSGLSNKSSGFDCDVLLSPTNNTINTSGAIFTPRVGLAVHNEIGFDLVAALTITTVAIIIINENKNQTIFNDTLWGQHIQTHTQVHHAVALGIDRYDRIGLTGVGLVAFNDNVCIFDGNIDRNGFDNNTTLGMFVYIIIFIFSFFLFFRLVI